MTIGEKISKARRDNHYTQEQLAEKLDVSRQAISKWESNAAYPETDKLIKISELFGCSLDYLLKDTMDSDNNFYAASKTDAKKFTGKILIKNFEGTAIVNCIQVDILPIAFPTKREPKYILNGIDHIGFFGPHRVNLAFYEDEETIKKEIKEIYDAMKKGEHEYELKYQADVEMKGLSPKLRRK